jgi:hypothetical protein
MAKPDFPLSVNVAKDSKTGADLNSLKNSLEILAKEAEEFHNIRDVFERALLAMYYMQPNGGENYGGRHPRICNIKFDVPGRNPHGYIDLDYILTGGDDSKDSRFVKINLKGSSHGCFSRTVRINFIEKTYCPLHISWGKSCSRADYLFQKDTKNIMNYLGLKRKRA